MKRGVLVIFLMYCSFLFFFSSLSHPRPLVFFFFLSLFAIFLIPSRRRETPTRKQFLGPISTRGSMNAWRKRGKRWKDVPAKLILITSFTMGDKKPSAILPLSSQEQNIKSTIYIYIYINIIYSVCMLCTKETLDAVK